MAGEYSGNAKKLTDITSMMYYRIVLLLFAVLYLISVFAVDSAVPLKEVLLPRIVVGGIAAVIAILSFWVPAVKKYLQEVFVSFLTLATVHLIFFLFRNNFSTHFELVVLTLILFSNLHITSLAFLVLYNVLVLGAIEFILISGDVKGLNPVAVFVSVAVVILFSVLYQLFRMRNASSAAPVNTIAENIFRQSAPVLVFEKRGFTLYDANLKAIELFLLPTSKNAWRGLTIQKLFGIIEPNAEVLSLILNEELTDKFVVHQAEDGNQIPLNITAHVLENNQNFVVVNVENVNDLPPERITATGKNEFELLPVAIAITDLKGNKISATKALEDLLLEKNVSSESLLNVLNEDERLTFEMVAEKSFMLSKIEGCRLHFRKIKPENKCVWIFTDDNTAISSHASHEQVAVAHFFEGDDFPVANLNADGKIISSNNKFNLLVGYTAEEIKALSFADLMHPIDALSVEKLKNISRSEKRLMHKSGKVVFVQLSCIAKSENEITLFAEDVTSIKVTQRELQTAKANVTSVIENTNDLIFSVDTQNRITVLNSAFKKHFSDEYEKHIAEGDDYRSKLPESEKQQWSLLHDRVLKGEKIISQETIAEEEGSKTYLEISLNPIYDENNFITGVSFFGRDVTSRMIYESEIVKAKEVAEDATNAKSQFLATMSHEIRTPLNGMLGMLELLRTTNLTNKQREYVNTIKLSGESLMNIINDVLDFSKIESDKMQLDVKPFNLRKVVEETFDVFYYRSLEKQLELFYSVDANIPPSIMGDSIRLKQILINLVGNALKFTEKGHILIRAELTNVTGNNFEIKFSVKDTGIGISQENIDKLFTAFTQADSSTFRKYGGTGLGLTISNKLVSMMSGKIWVESIPGEGSTFFFTIQSSLAPDASQRYIRTNLRLLRGKIFVLISSNSEVRNQYQIYANDWGIQLSAYNNARETLAAVNEKMQPDAVLIDASIKNYLLYAEELRDINQSLSVPLIAVNGAILENNGTVFGNKIFEAVISSDASKARVADILLSIFTNPSRSYALDEEEQDEVDNTLAEKIPIKILVAEDNPINQTLAEMVLSKLGYKIEMAGNGKEALEKIKTSLFDLVFMDVQMPEMDGLEATESLRKQDSLKQPIVIAMTAFAMQSDKEKCIEAGMNDYISKPIRIEDIQSIIIKWKEKFEVASVINQKDAKPVLLLDATVIENLKRLENGNGTSFVKDLLIAFTKQVKSISDEIKLNYVDGNLDLVYKSAHKLKGSSLNVGARKLASVCEDLEVASKVKDSDKVERIVTELNAVVAQTINSYAAYEIK
ncbi:MAG TPA: ATP-binding protein [Bacteroidia bacterium]|nr:ATP-binding protein [Bacteroidia bacterium]HNU33129.1 ATP-binding protein [Bacteroidia bacterium]